MAPAFGVNDESENGWSGAAARSAAALPPSVEPNRANGAAASARTSCAATTAPVPWWGYLNCAVLAVAFAYPFFAVVDTKSEDSDFTPCDESCTFVQFIGYCDKHLPPTFPENVEKSGGWIHEKHIPRVFPVYVSVQNGGKMEARGPHLYFQNWLPYFYSYYPALFSSMVRRGTTDQFPSSQAANQTICDSIKAKKLHKHLDHGPSRVFYLVTIIIWTILCIAHDWALLYGCPEKWTLSIGLAAFAAQATACTASFLWGSSAVKVFLAEDEASQVTCYYRLGTLSMLLALVPPFLLWKATVTKLENLKLSIAHGDYLYAVLYHVPFRVVRRSIDAPTDSLLILTLHGDPGVSDAESPPVSFGDFRLLALGTRIATLLWLLTQLLVIGPFTIGPLFRRLLSEAVKTQVDSIGSLEAGMKYATYFLAVPVPVILALLGLYRWTGLVPLLIQRRGKKRKCGWLQTILMVLVCLIAMFTQLSAIVSTKYLVDTLLKDAADINELKESWEWYFHGTLTFLLVVFEAILLFSWPLILRSFIFIPPMYDFLLESSLADLKPEWKLEDHCKVFLGEDTPENGAPRKRKVDSVREALERTGSGLRWHVPLAAELIRAKLAEAEESSESSTDSDAFAEVCETLKLVGDV